MSLKQTTVSLDILHGTLDSIQQTKLLSFLDFIRREAIKRLGVGDQALNATMRTIDIRPDEAGVPQKSPSIASS